jgi:prephenate dehydratase
VASNALAARLVKDEPNAAAIASEVALGLYGDIYLQHFFGNLYQGAVHMRLLLMTLNINEE